MTDSRIVSNTLLTDISHPLDTSKTLENTVSETSPMNKHDLSPPHLRPKSNKPFENLASQELSTNEHYSQNSSTEPQISSISTKTNYSPPTTNHRIDNAISTYQKEGNRWHYFNRDGQEMYFNEITAETWIPTTDQHGQTYYYEVNSRHSVWELTDLDKESIDKNSNTNQYENQNQNLITVQDSNLVSVDNRTHDFNSDGSLDLEDEDLQNKNKFESVDHLPDLISTRSSTGIVKQRIKSRHKKLSRTSNNPELSPNLTVSRPLSTLSLDEHSTGHFQLKNLNRTYISGPQENKLTHFERRGTIYRTFLFENGARVSKKWLPGFLLLSGPNLLLYKDVKSSMTKNQTAGKPDLQLNINEIEINNASGEHTSRKNVLKIEYNVNGQSNVCLIQFPPREFDCWKTAINYAREIINKHLGRTMSRSSTKRETGLDSGILMKLREFFRTRPTAAVLRSRGILKNESVFASTILQICEYENSDVPNFVVRSIRAIEARGLDRVGIYRVSGNGAAIQRLRCAVNQYNYSLNSEKWSPEVLTGALKLFFRELKEPLFICKIYPEISELMKNSVLPTDERVSILKNLINSMPYPHVNTARILFHHLYRVMEKAEINQMYSQTLAIVFGPSLLWPENESTVFDSVANVQAPCIEFIISNVVPIFGPPIPPPVIS